jgi:hypothetical protein
MIARADPAGLDALSFEGGFHRSSVCISTLRNARDFTALSFPESVVEHFPDRGGD